MLRQILTLATFLVMTACEDTSRNSGEKVPLSTHRTSSHADNSRPLQVSAANYRSAEQWLRGNVTKLVRNLTVQPHWIGDTDTFWYLAEIPGGKRFTIVDAPTGVKRPAFDHLAVAAAMRAAGVNETEASNLPFSVFSFQDNGRAIVFAVGETRYRCVLQPVECTVSRKDALPSSLLLSPDGRLGVRTDGGNLVLTDLETGAERPLTADGEPHFGYGIYYGNWKARSVPRARAGGDGNFPPMETYWAGDSRHLLATRLDERHVEEYYFLETAPLGGSFRPILHTARIPLTGEEPAKMDWFVIDAESGLKVRIDLPYKKLFHVHQDMLAVRKHWWSEDYSRLYLLAWGDRIESARLYEVDVGTGKAQEVLAEEMRPRMDTNSTSYNPPNVFVIDNGKQAIWFSQRSGWGHLYRYDLHTGQLLNPITSGEWLVRDIIYVDEHGRQLFFTGSGRESGDPYYRYLYRVNFDGTDLTLLSPEKADHMIDSPYHNIMARPGSGSFETVSPSGDYVIYGYSTVTEPPRWVIRRAVDGGLIAEFEHADASELYATGWRDPEPFVAKADDGVTDVCGLMYLPADLHPEGNYPVIDSQYASPLTAVVPHNFNAAIAGPPGIYTPASLTALGFVSVVIDARGTTFRDRAFSHHSWQNLNQIGLYDHIAAIKQLASERKWMDLERVGIQGSSYGGFATLRGMLEYPEFYRVGVAAVPVASVSAMYPDYHMEAYHGEAIYADGTALRPSPDARPVNYLNNDASLQADKLVGDLLILMGELDENVLPANTLQLIDTLVREDIDFDMYYFPNRPHHLGSPFAIRKSWDYFVENLMGREAPKYRMTIKDTVWQQ